MMLTVPAPASGSPLSRRPPPGSWLVAVGVLAGSLLCAAYVFHVVGVMLQRPASPPPRRAPVPWAMDASALGMAEVAILLGLWSSAPLELLAASRGFPW